MNEASEGLNCNEMKAELQALRKKLEDLETKQAAFKISTHPTVPRRFPKRLVVASISVAALVVAGGLLWGQGEIKALFIDKDGNARFNGTVGINYNPIPNQDLVITPKTGDLALNITDPAHTLNRLMVSANGDVIINGGSVGIGTTTPTAGKKLDVIGDARVTGSLNVKNVGINRDPIPDQNLVITPTQGNTPFNVTDPANSINWLSVLSDGRVIMNGGNVGIGTTNPDPTAKLDVVGDVRIQGKLTSRGRYQRDDDPETTYGIPPRYHLSLTAPKYAGRTKTIPQNVLVALCGGPDGCEVRLAMTRWDSDLETESASRSVLFYYSASDGHWRASRGETDIIGVDGDGTTTHVISIWNTCYFTDGTYSNYQDLGDKEKGMQLLVGGPPWKGYGNGNRTCELTLIK